MLTVEHLSKTFHMRILEDKRIDGCRDVSFQVGPGELLALAGPSGKGKSTVLKCVYRTYLPTAGRIRYSSLTLGEMDLATAPEREILEVRRREIGYMSQFLQVVPRVPALDLVMEPILARNAATRDEARERATALLRRLCIPDNLHQAYPATFSGGEQQRVNLARAVAWRPRLLLIDEPTASLDPRSIEIVLEILGELRQQGTAMIGIFHDHRLMEKHASRILPL
jgi:alpha-D-ribose 1-methylphosphonate 5-triphosphate synthase subunit PhnL